MAENFVKYFPKGGNEWVWICQILVESFLSYWGLLDLHNKFRQSLVTEPGTDDILKNKLILWFCFFFFNLCITKTQVSVFSSTRGCFGRGAVIHKWKKKKQNHNVIFRSFSSFIVFLYFSSCFSFFTLSSFSSSG